MIRPALLLIAAFWACGTAAAHTIYVSNERSNTIAAVDSDSLKVVRTIKVGRRPRGIVLSADNRALYVCIGDQNRIEVVDLAQGRVTGTLPSGPDPELLIRNPVKPLLYVSNEDDNTVSVIDLATRRLVKAIQVGVEPEGMGISPDGTLLVNTSETTSMAHLIDTAQGRVIDNILVGARPRVAVFSADGSRLWVSSEIGGNVTVIDVASHKVIGRIGFAIPGILPSAIQAVGVRLSADGKRAFVALGPANRVAEVDQQSLQVLRYHLVGQRVWNLAFSPDETRLYTTNGISGDMTVIDLVQDRAIRSIPVGDAPWGVVVAP